MFLIIAVLLLALILGGVGLAASALHLLLWIGIAIFVIWLLGFVIRSAEGAGRSRGRWYRW